MSYTFSFIIAFSVFFCIPLKAHAIIVLPALILIPIAQLIAPIIGFFSVPLAAISLLIKKTFKHSTKKTLFIFFLTLIIIAAIIATALKITNPARPWF